MTRVVPDDSQDRKRASSLTRVFQSKSSTKWLLIFGLLLLPVLDLLLIQMNMDIVQSANTMLNWQLDDVEPPVDAPKDVPLLPPPFRPHDSFPYDPSKPLKKASFTTWRYTWKKLSKFWPCADADKIVVYQMSGHLRTLKDHASTIKSWLDSLHSDVCWFVTLAVWEKIDTETIAPWRQRFSPTGSEQPDKQKQLAALDSAQYIPSIRRIFGEDRISHAIVATEKFEIGSGSHRSWQLWRVAHDLLHSTLHKNGHSLKNYWDRVIVVHTRPDIVLSHSLDFSRFFRVLSPNIQQTVVLQENPAFVGMRDPSEVFFLANLAGHTWITNRLLEHDNRTHFLFQENILEAKLSPPDMNGNRVQVPMQMAFFPPSFGFLFHRISGASTTLPKRYGVLTDWKIDLTPNFQHREKVDILGTVQCVRAIDKASESTLSNHCDGHLLNANLCYLFRLSIDTDTVGLDQCFKEDQNTAFCGKIGELMGQRHC